VFTAKTKIDTDVHQINFDTDSFVIGVDSHASRCLSNKIEHFISPLRSTKYGFIKGVGGERLEVKGEGKLVWHIEDDQARVH
jgi:hypothetical protein